MSTDTDGADDGGRMAKLDVRVPEELLDAIEREYSERGYATRSEAIRDALRTWVDPPNRVSDEFLEDLAVSREQAKRGETHSADEVRERLGLDGDE